MSLEYKGYVSSPISYDEGTFSAVIEGIQDVIHFEGENADDLERAFKDSIDDYLDMCTRDGVEPDRAFSGQFMVRTDSKIHRSVALRAASEGKSLNQWVTDVLAQASFFQKSLKINQRRIREAVTKEDTVAHNLVDDR